jgi:hypothetical protein
MADVGSSPLSGFYSKADTGVERRGQDARGFPYFTHDFVVYLIEVAGNQQV